MVMSKDVLISQMRRELRRRDFWEFCLHMDYDFFMSRPFLADVARDLQFVADEYRQGRAVKVSLSLPPRAGKSYIVSMFCVWWLGNFPTLSVMRNTCTSTLYRKFSYDVRKLVREQRARDTFPAMQLAGDKANLDGWNLATSKQVGYFGGGVGGTIIGFGANIAITDDLYKDMKDATSPGTKENVAVWKESAHNSRMETHCPEIFIGTRWTMNDEIGKAIAKGNIARVTKLPALIDCIYETVDGKQKLISAKSFCENVKTTDEYLFIKGDIDEAIWDAEYMQEPTEIKGLLFPKDSLKYFRPERLPKAAEFRHTAIDPADVGGDDTSAPFSELHGSSVYIKSVLYNNEGTDFSIPELVEAIVGDGVNHVDIEGVSAWVMFGKQIRTAVNERHRACVVRILKSVGKASKRTRIIEASAWIRNYCYFLEEDLWTPEYKKFMKVLTGYLRDAPGEQKDDAPDSLSIVANFYRNRFPHLYKYVKGETEHK